MVFQLYKDIIEFPDPHMGDEDGLLAVGGDLSTGRLLMAYENGIFPWYDFRRCPQIEWWCPMQRFVIFPANIHISHSMRTLLNKQAYKTTISQATEKVIDHCSQLRLNQQGAWLGKEMVAAFKELNRAGYIKSIEVWDAQHQLVGGLYGVSIGRNFFGESMFSLTPSASKIALIALAETLKNNGGLIDCQFETPHLKSMGGTTIPYDDYMKILNSSLNYNNRLLEKE